MRTGRWLASVVALGLFVGLSCAVYSAEGARADSTPQSGNNKSTELSADDVVKIAGVSQDLSYECEGRSFSVSGTSNTVKLTGQCHNLKVTGTTNRVDVEAVATIDVSGIRNQVTWERGVNNKPPSISNSGINNNVSHKKK